jgi:hypothetical protein
MTFQEMRNQANRVRGIPLEHILPLTGAKRDQYDRAKWHTEKGPISCTATKFMNWSQGVGGGGAIDLAMHLNSLDFKAAVAWLSDRFPEFAQPKSVRISSTTRLLLPPQDPSRLPAVRRYLIQERALPAPLIQILIDSGRLYADHRSNAVFLLLGKENNPVGAELRGITAARWRGMAPGSHKDLGYFSVPAPQATAVVLCESAIDAISCVALYPGCLCVSTSGARPNPGWLPWLIGQGFEAYCGFDTDLTGEHMSEALIALYPSVKRLRPNQHDWNDVLKINVESRIPLT